MIRNATWDDLAEIVAIYNAAIPGRLATADTEAVSVDSRHSWFQDHEPSHHPLWVYEDGQVVGWLSLNTFYARSAFDETAEVSLYITPHRQRGGLAKALLSQAIEQAPSLGLRTLLGLIFSHNQPSLRLFHNFGFEVWGRLPRVCVLDGVQRDVMILGRHVGSKD